MNKIKISIGIITLIALVGGGVWSKMSSKINEGNEEKKVIRNLKDIKTSKEINEAEQTEKKRKKNHLKSSHQLVDLLLHTKHMTDN